jgi:hypothetical protein
MATDLTGAQKDALDYLYGGGDETIECQKAEWVVTRHPQKCVSVLHKGVMTMPAGTRMVRETAKVEGQFGSCYTCLTCLAAVQMELEG